MLMLSIARFVFAFCERSRRAFVAFSVCSRFRRAFNVLALFDNFRGPGAPRYTRRQDEDRAKVEASVVKIPR